MTVTRREFCRDISLAGTALALSPAWRAAHADTEVLPARPIPGSGFELPVVGLGNSNAFRGVDVPASMELIGLLHNHGGSYIDCSGPSRFTVAEAAKRLGIGRDLFLGSYFTEEDETAVRAEADRLLALTGKTQLDLMHSYPEFAIPNWRLFERWKDEGLTRFIGLARHRSEYYASMMELMETGTVDFIQVNYSPLETEADQEILPMAKDKGVAVTINRPFINGEYFTKVRGHTVPEWAREFDCDNWAAFSIKFILSNPAVTCVLTETANPSHATQNLNAGFGRLPDEKTRQRMVSHLRDL
jgi:diketogulonate reductase-like aldo/keto reductase